MSGGGFPIDLVLFGMIAAFLVLRLRGILGRRTGFEQTPQPYQAPAGPSSKVGPIIDSVAEPTAPAVTRTLPDPSSPLGQTLGRMAALDRTFTPAGFLNGAEKAFRMVVTAFASGDRATLRSLLGDDTWRAFDQALTARENMEQTQQTEIRAMHSAAIEGADLHGNTAEITVRLVSDQINLTRDRTGHPVVGTDGVTEITDVWTFERVLGSPDPSWRLIAARSA